jgi:predicted dienelactone hydrolase
MKRITSTSRGLAAALLALGIAGSGSAVAADDLRVGHTVEHMKVTGSALNETREVDVHLWYPAEPGGRSKARYTSALYHQKLPAPWTPLSWRIKAEVAHEDAPIRRDGERFPVIVFSHGSVNDPIDYAHTLERIAGAGFVVAAPSHVNNTQEDVRIDFINTQAGFQLFPCNDGRPSPCSRPDLARSMQDRVRDIGATLDKLPGWLGGRADVDRAGVLGHSRGTVTALAAAGGSTLWGFGPEPRVKAIMGMAIGTAAVTSGANVANVMVPTVLVAGVLDMTSLHEVSQAAFDQLGTTDKTFVSIPKAVHRSFDSTYCDQVQAAGAIAQEDPNAILDRHTANGIARHPSSGWATEYCAQETFTEPVDIRPLIATLTGVPFPSTVPSTGLETDEVKLQMTELAVDFFGRVLGRR